MTENEKKLWLKLSASINYYLRYYDYEKTDEELLEDYMYYTFEQEDDVLKYLDKKTYEWVVVSDEVLEKVKVAFRERLAKKRLKEKEFKKVKVEEEKEMAKVINLFR